jgi:pseudolysin
MMINMRVHERMDNAYWDGAQMTFGDGISVFYPLVSLGVGAHEISHGFTEHHSGLYYWSQSGGLNEAFSDMAAQAAEFYSVGHNSWQIGPEILKGAGALRYMIKPSDDCNGGKPGNWCSIDKVSQYKEGLDVHYSSGIFNRVFYLIGSADGWDTKKAFDIMVHANAYYWTANTTWSEAACGVLKAAHDYGYDTAVVKNAFNIVEVDYSKC